MESGHAEAASMAATAAASGDLLDRFDLNGISVKEHNELVKSVEQHRASVGRIILVKRKEIIQTGTAFLVYKGDERSLFLTCNHNFKERLSGEVIRLLPTAKGDKIKDCAIEHIVYRHESRDILLFTVKDLLPQRQCLELSTDVVKEKDKVVLVGFSGGGLLINNEKKEHRPAAVVAHSILSGVVLAKYESQTDQYHEEIYYSCSQAIRGHSGSPVCKNGKVVAVHIAADRTCRDGASTNTVMHCLREHLRLKGGSDDVDKLLKDFYEKSAHVPYGGKKRKGKAMQ